MLLLLIGLQKGIAWNSFSSKHDVVVQKRGEVEYIYIKQIPSSTISKSIGHKYFQLSKIKEDLD